MKHKRLNRDGWGFQYFPYYQVRIDNDSFHGLVCLIKIVEGDYQYWEMPKAGKAAVCGGGMTWLQLIPDGKKRVITVKYYHDADSINPERTQYPSWAAETMCPSVWYVDITDGIEYDEEGIAVYIDKYLDVIFSPEGDYKLDDKEELDEALKKGELTKDSYEEAIKEAEDVTKELCRDVKATAEWCADIRRQAEEKIAAGHKPMYLFHGSTERYERLEPQQAHGQCEKEALFAIYAAESLRDVIPFALPIRCFPDGPGGKKAFNCDAGKTYVEYGFVDPTRDGYVYRVKADTFQKVDEWEWVSKEPVVPLEIKVIPGKNMLHTVSFSPQAKEIQDKMFPLSDI